MAAYQSAFDINDSLGREQSLFYKVNWAQQAQMPNAIKAFNFSKSQSYNPRENLDRYNSYAITMDPPSATTSFASTTLEALRTFAGGPAFNDNHWTCNVNEDGQGRLTISNVGIYSSTMMGMPMPMTHNVFSSIEFRDIVVTLVFTKADNSKYEMNLYLDQNSLNNNITPSSTVKRYVGTNGKIGSDSNFQIGLNQKLIYTVKAGNKYVFFLIDLSFVFKYPSGDFDPAGFINASKIYPQIQLLSFYYNTLDYPSIDIDTANLFDNVLDVTSLLSAVPGSAILPESISIKSYDARIKMCVNNDNSAHVNLTTPVGGVQYDQNYLGTLRAGGKPIPDMFEKQFLSSIGKNIAGFYVDSNTSTSPDKRLLPDYQTAYAPGGVGQQFLAGVKGLPDLSPWWASAFDYVDYYLKTEKEFTAVWGTQDTRYSPGNQEFIASAEDSYNYPSTTSSTNGVTLRKVGRQGAYDNMHIQGYLGHYKDSLAGNEKIVIHAPVCGFCCLHMHWRWGKRAYNIGENWFINGFRSKVGEKFAGWGIGKDKMIRSFSNPGDPLIPYNQHLNIAITNPSSTPATENGLILPTNITNLDPDVKAIWYAVHIDAKLLDSYVILEQGLGFAFSYAKAADIMTGSPSVGGLSDILSLPAYLGISETAYPDFFAALATMVTTTWSDGMGGMVAVSDNYTTLSVAEVYEILYRLMRFYNKGTYAGYDQIPSNINVPGDVNVYPNITSAIPSHSFSMENQ